ncbi:MAG: nitrate reductase cytochrome c-type subunit [Sedimenticola sp.]|uniref:Periplasmic nitrate reductase, electron transfer subunit n=1 Tax=Sedimenticola thiotaurini TaxID=1543721 RepID=A0A558D1T3_9GAMM|nr:nitrate reductase cytochrome c-type subunit [Sedimenticola sp.]MCW8947322.1 nitrate reductase cytochrome c-type subunit [Sedimenticola sp.]MCW8975360.1 nitrate reductase cytochrome c-type subunit [Sedimenticola sp.]MCW9022378.1 nitrate reductase cytochrome c-type subunit [Sedimenticola sp.]TVT54970.1 MAG: nitrate reductase cytochrome c-type subunit [Sedimenticola thiotaurini]
MKKVIVTLLVAMVTLMFTGAAISGVTSLRGDNEVSAPADKAPMRKQVITQGGVERSYKIQPPMIPHKIDKETINLKINTCLKCHSEKTFEEKKAPKAGDSHYIARDGKVLETISTRRYFCNQCHAPQLNANPIVENQFEGAK